jgi:tRNA(fMet)-specific endonuclease VapC
MTGNKCLLDTSVIIHTFRKNNTIAEQLDKISEIFIPATVVGELYFGAYKSADPPRHIIQTQSFLLSCKILPTDSGTAEIYGKIKAALSKKGKPIPENDIWIAAIATQYDLPLFTSDNHFAEIEGLALFK